jgi:hypothetical protein
MHGLFYDLFSFSDVSWETGAWTQIKAIRITIGDTCQLVSLSANAALSNRSATIAQMQKVHELAKSFLRSRQLNITPFRDISFATAADDLPVWDFKDDLLEEDITDGKDPMDCLPYELAMKTRSRIELSLNH